MSNRISLFRLNKDILGIIYRLLLCDQIKQLNAEYHNTFALNITRIYNDIDVIISVKNSSFGLCFNYRKKVDQVWHFSNIYHWIIYAPPNSSQLSQTSYKLSKNY